MISNARLLAAYEKARLDLLAERDPAGHWVGELATSALSTATAVSALAIVERHGATDASGCFADESRESRLSSMIVGGLHWLADHQNPDGGWGDTDKSYSNIATSMLVVAAFNLTGVPADHADMIERAEQYIESQGGIAGLRRRYGRDKTFAVPILTNYALAGLVPWREVSPLPFELACVPQKFYHLLQLPVVSYAIPALVAIGQARYFHQPPWNPLTRLARRLSVARTMEVLQRMQPASGGFLEAVPLTSFVTMSLASTGRADHPVAKQGAEFLINSVRPDGSWPIDTNLATWNTTLAMVALAGAGEDITELECLDWLLGCQYQEVHPYTLAAPGGWGWSDLSGAVPDCDDTPGALLALRHWHDAPGCEDADRQRICASAAKGIRWVLDLQNRDGGWPTFCRGWGALPFDRSGADLTAHALRALSAWRSVGDESEIEPAIERGFQFLGRRQRDDGSWIPLWFGNQDHPQEENPIYGTAKVLLAYRDLGRMATDEVTQGLGYLVRSQQPDGGWGGTARGPDGRRGKHRSSVEETALAVETLLAGGFEAVSQTVIEKGVEWLVSAVEADRHKENSPIGFYFAKLWYYERLYPLTFTVSALGQACRNQLPAAERPATALRLPHA